MAKNKNNKSTKTTVENTEKTTKVASKKPAAAPAPAPAPEPKVETPKVEEVKVTEKKADPVSVIDLQDFTKKMTQTSAEGLDPNRRVDLLKMMHDTFRTDANAAQKYGMSQDAIDKINKITAIGQIAAFTCEVVYAKNPFAVRMQPSQLEDIIAIGELVGLQIDKKFLPAPAEDGTITVSSEAMTVSEEATKQVMEEKAVEEDKPELDPTKIYSDDAAIEKALSYIFVVNKSIFTAIQEGLSFLKSVHAIRAEHAENPEDAKALLASYTTADIFNDLTSRIRPTLLFTGIGKHMANLTHFSKSPIPAFAALRNASKNKETGVTTHSDAYIAELTKAIVIWVVNNLIDSYKKSIDNLDPKKNADEIKKCEEAIAYHKETLEYICNPSVDTIATLIEDFASDDNTTKARAAQIIKSIRGTYYADVDFKATTYVNLNQNLCTYAGVITNLFRDPTQHIVGYDAADIHELVPLTEEESKKE